jgi:hypothetical protein
MGTAVGSMVVVIGALVAYLHYYGQGLRADNQAELERQDAEDKQQFGATCANIEGHLSKVLHEQVDPAIAKGVSPKDSRRLITPEMLKSLDGLPGFTRRCVLRIHGGKPKGLHDSRLLAASLHYIELKNLLSGTLLCGDDSSCQASLLSRARFTRENLRALLPFESPQKSAN